MKICINFSLDEKIVYELRKEKNRSTLVNTYLLNYYGLNKNNSSKDFQESQDSKAGAGAGAELTEEVGEEINGAFDGEIIK